MSKTIRVSNKLYEVLDDAREKDETFQDVIEELASEAGLLPSEIRNADDLRQKLRMEYGYEDEEVRDVLEALRFVYTGQEQENSIGVPHAFADERYGDEVDALVRLNLIEEKHYTGKYDYGYRTTPLGEEIGSELVRELLDERTQDLETLINGLDDVLLSVLVKFGFKKTDTDHLSNRGATLSRYFVDGVWDVPELTSRYQTFKNDLCDLGIAVRYGRDPPRIVLPPEFQDFLNQRVDTELSSVMRQIELYQILLSYVNGELETRDDILEHLETASEEDFEAVIDDFYQQKLTSRYLSDQETPLLIKDREGVREQIETEMKQLLNIA